METQPFLTKENRFDAPLSYVSSWLTDFREDDGRYWEDATPFRVVREGNRVHREQVSAFGPMKQVITLESPSRWRAESEVRSPQGQLLFRLKILETLRQEGSSTVHNVVLHIEPSGDDVAKMLAGIRDSWAAVLDRGFVTIKAEMEAAARAGKLATA